jgi:hypothetical protein
MPHHDFATVLPHGAPAEGRSRLLLLAIRRMAAHGLDDAHAAHACLTGFGLGYRRPMILLRALMAEISRASERKILVAPCCCPRMTRDEAALLYAIETAPADRFKAHGALESLLGTPLCLGALTSAEALGEAVLELSA